MSKRKGFPYEQVVAEILKAMDPGSSVNQGQWVIGPDGRRELDILIQGTLDGEEHRVMVECKDFNPDPKITGPVGIEHVDALESKWRDLNLQFVAICSNAGFTRGAVSKASRTGIGLISVMKKGDRRIRFSVTEELYTRQVNVEELSTNLDGPDSINSKGVRIEDVTYKGISVGNWVEHRVLLIISSNPIVYGTYTACHPLQEQLEFVTPSGSIAVTQVDFRFHITGGWYSQQVTLDSTQGVFDWLHHRVMLTPGPGQFMIEGVDIYAGEPIDKPPDRELRGYKDIRPGGFKVRLLLVSGLEPLLPIPDLDKYIESHDLDHEIPNLPVEAYTSVVS